VQRRAQNLRRGSDKAGKESAMYCRTHWRDAPCPASSCLRPSPPAACTFRGDPYTPPAAAASPLSSSIYSTDGQRVSGCQAWRRHTEHTEALTPLTQLMWAVEEASRVRATSRRLLSAASNSSCPSWACDSVACTQRPDQ
jgi:hypothetical protein